MQTFPLAENRGQPLLVIQVQLCERLLRGGQFVPCLGDCSLVSVEDWQRNRNRNGPVGASADAVVDHVDHSHDADVGPRLDAGPRDRSASPLNVGHRGGNFRTRRL